MDKDLDAARGSLAENPFVLLFPCLEVAEKYVSQQRVANNDLVERIFLVTIDCESHGSDGLRKLPPVCVFLETVYDCQISQAIEQVLTERIKMDDPENFLVDRYQVPRYCNADEKQASETDTLQYLFQTYERLLCEELKSSAETLQTLQLCRRVILEKLADFLRKTNFKAGPLPTCRCVHEVANYLADFETPRLQEVFLPMLENLAQEIKEDSFFDPGIFVHLNMLSIFADHPHLAKLTLEYQTSDEPPLPILHILLEKSCLTVDGQDSPFFNEAHEMTEIKIKSDIEEIHNKLNSFHTSLAGLFRKLLKNESTKAKLLSMIGDLLFHFQEMKKRWIHDVSNILNGMFLSDALFFNLSSVLLQLCQPFCSKSSLDSTEDSTARKFLKIDPSYVIATANTNAMERENKSVHGKNFHEDTCLLPTASDQTIAISPSYNMITEMFFFAHRALQLGTYGMLLKFKRIAIQLTALNKRETWNNLSNEGQKRYEKGLKIYLSTKATMTEPAYIENCLNFFATSAQFLIQTAMTDDRSHIARVTLPIPDEQPIPNGLSCLPEYILDNMNDIISFAYSYCEESIQCLHTFNHDFLLMATIYIGNKNRISNPHLRASLAKMCQYFLPLAKNDIQINPIFESTGDLFEQFQYGPMLGISLLTIFVDVEYTGAHAEAEEKFSYRVPVYRILNYLWTKDNCRKEILLCAEESIRNIEDQSKPLFLNFIEYVISDLNFSMDDVLEFLKKIKVLEREKGSGEWDHLSETDREMNEKKVRQYRGLVSYRNKMANFGIELMVQISSEAEVKKFFWHPIMRNRIAQMFNNFLLKMVGSEMGALRVSDIHSLKFQPKDLLCNITRIYISLCEDDEFCRSIATDERSYRADLFQRACQILRRFDDFLKQEMQLVADRVATMSEFVQEDEELYKEAPEEFFDAFISTFMQDPVILPSSRQVVDRSTIARHLMSDQTDPYNRSPLTMSEVIPHTALRQRIQAWLEENRERRRNNVR